MIRVGDCQAARKEWSAAAAAYHLAWERDRSRPAPLASEAAALTQLGQSERARPLLALAHLLPLSNDGFRVDLADTLSRGGLADEARREHETILATAPFLSWGLCHVVRLRGDDAVAKNDPATAVRFWERAFLQNLKYNVGFGDAWANSAVPALIHRTRAEGLIKASDWVDALQEAKRCRATSPGDADAMIQIVGDFEQHGRKQEADDLFNTTMASYAKLAALYPESGPLENLQAWLAAKCRRNLDEALRQALHATAIEPKNTASLDTLAEVYFQRGQVAEAITAMNRCIELEPTVEPHRKQLERFKAAMKSGS
jgi:tetratricopeptide (TPR) repeat protein